MRIRVTRANHAEGGEGRLLEFLGIKREFWVGEGGWVAVDFDGTLASTRNVGHFEYPFPLGGPVEEIIGLVGEILESGIGVKVFTARANEMELYGEKIRCWCRENVGRELEITSIKDYGMVCMLDDRAVGVKANEGVLYG